MLNPSSARRPNLQSETTALHLFVDFTAVDSFPKISAPRQSESPRMKRAPGLVGTVVVGTAVEEDDVGLKPLAGGRVDVVDVVVSTARAGVD
ncbi:MAG: hypothetical protein RLZ84_39 [Actinomycetota bacterium]